MATGGKVNGVQTRVPSDHAYTGTIQSSASKYGVDPNLITAVAMQESSLGKAGKNVMQVNGMNNSAPEQSIDVGSRMLSGYLKQTGNLEWSLAMYNMGPGIYTWAKNNGISDPRQAMAQFSEYQKQKNGYKIYGDPNYIDNVLRYYG